MKGYYKPRSDREAIDEDGWFGTLDRLQVWRLLSGYCPDESHHRPSTSTLMFQVFAGQPPYVVNNRRVSFPKERIPAYRPARPLSPARPGWVPTSEPSLDDERPSVLGTRGRLATRPIRSCIARQGTRRTRVSATHAGLSWSSISMLCTSVSCVPAGTSTTSLSAA